MSKKNSSIREWIEKAWLRISTTVNRRRVDEVFYFGSTVHWWEWSSIERGANRRTIAVWHPIKELSSHCVFVDITLKGYELFVPILILGGLGKYRHGVILADVKLHDVLTQEQFTDWLKKINEFPYV